MKLRQFNTENTKVLRQGSPSIGVNQTTGLFNLNKLACDLVGIKDNDQIIIHQDEEDTDNYYLEKVKAHGFVCREKKAITTGCLFNNTALARQIGEDRGIEGSYRILVAGEPTMFEKRKLFGLLFKNF